MRLLSFLSDIEQALKAQSTAGAATWQTTRIVNYDYGFARLTLSPSPTDRGGLVAGSIFLQVFTLADNSKCIKASLNWEGSTDCALVTVYATPEPDWRQRAAAIASTWTTGPAQEHALGSGSFAATQMASAG